ncbi:MAG TPA: 3',5'-cyclic-nucleotide phosphodiesterase [Candidatus Goldiibacteriota bacterium]|nr:3',5'-cyclic-nucleotide phosphodiesterase [Candidatus Goldiibacteriota bacterium]
MKIKVLGCYGGQMPGKNNTGFLLNDDTLIDAGTIASTSDIKMQRKIKVIILSHPHLDHVGAIPFFGVNVTSNKSTGTDIYGSAFTINAVKNHLMNGIIWPDFTKIKNFAGNYVFRYKILTDNKWYNLNGYRVRMIPVKHTIPTYGFIIGRDDKYILYSGDTKETDDIWRQAKQLGNKLKAVFVETAYPDNLSSLAENSGHLTPATLQMQLKKLGNLKPKVFVYHIKPEYEKIIEREMKKIIGYKIILTKEARTYII